MLQENAELAASLQGELDDVVKIEQRMREVQELIQHFAENVAQQEEGLAVVHQATAEAAASVDDGMEQLVRAAKASRSSANLQFTAIIVLTLILLVLDNFVLS